MILPSPAATRWPFLVALVLALHCGWSTQAAPETGRKGVRIVKVLPHFLDKEGRHTIHPSLFDRDAYQFQLKQNPDQRSGMRFDVQWRTPPGSPAALTLKLELRGSEAPTQAPVVVTSRTFTRGGFSQWVRVPLTEEAYQAVGELLAWRVTLWDADQLVAEQKSFLW